MSFNSLIVICLMGWGIGSFFCAQANRAIHPIMAITIGSFLHMLLTPILFVLFKVNMTVNMNGIVYSILCGLMMGIGSVAYFYAMQKNDAGETTFLCALYPGLTLLLSVAFLNEGMNYKKGVGIILAFFSFWCLSK